MSVTSTTTQTGFKREIKLFDAVMLVAGSMIGSGIFIVSADIGRSVGSAGYLLLVWALTGLMTLAGALSYGELTSLMPRAGGQYVYLRESYGPLVAFLYGWTLFLVIQSGTIAAVAVAFAKFTGVLVPWFSETNVLLDLGLLKFTSVQLLAIASIVLLTLINQQGVRNGKMIQNIFGSTKLIALFALLGFGLLLGTNAEVMNLNFSNLWDAQSVVLDKETGAITRTTLSGWALLVGISTAMIGSLFSSDSWNNIGFSGDEIVNPKRTIVLSMAIGTGLVTILYILINVVYLTILPLPGDPGATDALSRGLQFASNDRVGTAVAEVIGGAPATIAIAILIMISTFGCNNGVILSAPRVYYAMAKDGLFFPNMAKLNKNGVPGAALAIQCVWASVLCLSGRYSDLLDYVIFAVLLFYILTIAGIFILRSTMPDVPRPYKAIGYPVLPALYILMASFICIVLLIYKPNYSWPGLILVGVGIPVFYLFGKRFKQLEE
ncbi:APC family permease [Rufibacter latericius]|uniref:Amino acid permease n=1 Tax=Rufibacter latericius TaxID=2487040 RepID=A0A3M9MZR8_9BACT|nr:amino acid permease [Rufibacter latericius]RNI31034.1 amino acid permease [Rufibacter latericius]